MVKSDVNSEAAIAGIESINWPDPQPNRDTRCAAFSPLLKGTPPMNTLNQILYTARTRTTGGRDGAAASDDGQLNVRLSPPPGLGGKGDATNPEQLFGAGYSACFIGALRFVAGQKKIAVPNDVAIDAEVDLGPIAQGFGIAVRMNVSLPGMDRVTAQGLIDAAHQVCPYSNATRGNISVELKLI
jgi:osmotically inducible protein OsmC